VCVYFAGSRKVGGVPKEISRMIIRGYGTSLDVPEHPEMDLTIPGCRERGSEMDLNICLGSKA